ncbi:MAG: agmatinase [Deltaproteobacteria bacterium]|nr:agmatinase [Deltaproteobacteria bacterium]
MKPIPDRNSFLKYMVPVEDARFLILPVPYEQTTSYGKGTKDGPDAIIKASRYLELFDEDLDTEPYLKGIYTLAPINFEKGSLETSIEKIYKEVKALPIKDKFLISLGGEHSITYPIVRAYHEQFHSMTVLQIDAHSDLREEYEGTIYSHGSVMARIKDMAGIVQVGIRSQTKAEYDLIRQRGIHTFYMHTIRRDSLWKEHVVEALGDHVYLTIDLDGFDPSAAPGVGTPEPWGLSWYDVIDLVKLVIERRHLIGSDIVELAPVPLSVTTDFLAAKLAYKIMGYIAAQGG